MKAKNAQHSEEKKHFQVTTYIGCERGTFIKTALFSIIDFSLTRRASL